MPQASSEVGEYCSTAAFFESFVIDPPFPLKEFPAVKLVTFKRSL